MSKMSIEPERDAPERDALERHALNGPAMGTRWSALFFSPPDFDPSPVRASLQGAMDEIDAQMSIWKPDSNLMRLNSAALGEWVTMPRQFEEVLRLGIEIGRASDGAFDIGMGDAVMAWGFGPEAASPDRIRAAMSAPRIPAYEALDLGESQIRKTAPLMFDLNGIAKGFGVDRLAETLFGFGINAGLVGIDGEIRALGARPDGKAWAIAVEAPNPERREPHSVLTLQDAAVATSGDYRHWVEAQGRRLSHIMDPCKGAPLLASPASVTIVARTCAEADAWATALMVLGVDKGGSVARRLGLNALFLLRGDDGSTKSMEVGQFFSG